MFDYLIFDFDGTLSDTYPVFTEAMLKTLKLHRLTADYDEVYRQLKVSVGHCIKQYDFDNSKEEIDKEFMSYYHEMAPLMQEAIPGALELLKYTKEKGKMNIIYTHSGKIVYKMLEKMKLKDYIDYVLDGSNSFPRKPAPDALNYIVGECNIDRARALMIGDRDIDVDAGKNAGIKGCLLDPDGYYKDCQTDYYIDDLLDLKKII